MSVFKITKDNFNSEVLNSNQTVLIDFWANWCGPCRMLSPVVDEIAEETTGVKVCKVNVDEEPELSQAFQVMSIPMLAVMKNGKLVNKSVGVKPKAAIKQMLI
jgi:thioredoxin 1